MKILYKILMCIVLSAPIAKGQSINYSNLDSSSNHMSYLNFGYDYGLVLELGYGYKIDMKNPLWIQADISKPMGGDFGDDIKTRLGVSYKAFEYNQFVITAQAYGNYRTHETEFVQMKSFGSEFSGIIGRYGSKWITELEVGFDKAIVTQLNHSDAYKENYTGVQDGWYLPTAGNWFYGIRFGRSLGTNSLLSMDIGATNAQGSDRNALLPRYVKLGFSKTF